MRYRKHGEERTDVDLSQWKCVKFGSCWALELDVNKSVSGRVAMYKLELAVAISVDQLSTSKKFHSFPAKEKRRIILG